MRTKKTNIVSYEIAKLLKENGFNEDVYFRIYPDESIATSGYLCDYNSQNTNAYSAPTLSEVVDWIYDNFDVFIEIDYMRIPYSFDKKFKYFVVDLNDDNFGGNILFKSDDAYENKNKAITEALKKFLGKFETVEIVKQIPSNEISKEINILDNIKINVKKEKIEVL